MAVLLTISGVPYSYPETGEVDWGEDATTWAQAITKQVNNLTTVGDIAATSAVIQNSATKTAVTNLVFSTVYTKGAFIEYNISRTTSSSYFYETGLLILTYNPLETDPNLKWNITKYHSGSSGPTIDGVQFTAESIAGNKGQVYYTSDTVPDPGLNYSGNIKYRARVLR